LRSASGVGSRWLGRGETLTRGEPGTGVFAPGSVRIHAADAGGEASAVNRWRGTVATLDPAPGGVRLFTAEHPEIAVECPSTTALALGIRPGTELTFTVDADDVSVRSTR